MLFAFTDTMCVAIINYEAKMSDIINNLDNTINNNSKISGPKFKAAPKTQKNKESMASSPLVESDKTSISSEKSRKVPPNELQKIERWAEQLEKMDDIREERVDEVRQRLASGYYDNNPEVLDTLFDGLIEDLTKE